VFGNESIGKPQSFQNNASKEGVMSLALSSSAQSGQDFCPESTPERGMWGKNNVFKKVNGTQGTSPSLALSKP
jgi:hypothetical protein